MSKKIYYTDEELQRFGVELATLYNQIETLKEHKKDEVKSWNDKIANVRQEADHLASKLTTGFYEIPDEDLQGSFDLVDRPNMPDCRLQ